MLDVCEMYISGEVYVSQPFGFKKKVQKSKVYKLRKELYGLK